MHRPFWTAACLVPSFMLQSCLPTLQLEPPPLPPPLYVTPQVPEPPANSGMARVLITADQPARVWRDPPGIEPPLGTRYPRLGTLICDATPCAVFMPYGAYDLELQAIADPTRHSFARIAVQTPTLVVNHALGLRDRSQASRTLAVAGGVGLVLTLGVGGGVAKADGQLGEVGAIAALSTAAVSTLLLLLSLAYRDKQQPGATRTWTPESLQPPLEVR